jgi:hypothetical protein
LPRQYGSGLGLHGMRVAKPLIQRAIHPRNRPLPGLEQ